MSSQERYKGHEELIRVWGDVVRTYPDLSLTVIGDGDDRPRLESLARDLAVEVNFLGSVDDQTRDAALFDCSSFCLPSRGEGFGLVYLEAMRFGRPVLAGATDAGREIVIDNVTGRTVKPTDLAQLRDAILDVSVHRAVEFGRAGKERFESEYRYDRFLKRFKDGIDKVMDSARS